MIFWGPTGTKPYLWPDLDQIWFGGPFLALNKKEILTFEIWDGICHCLAPRMTFWGPTGAKPCLVPELVQICFGGHCLAFNKINVLSFEIGDKICHF